MRLCFFLSANVRSGANLSMLHHAVFCARAGHQVQIVFQHRFFDASLAFFEPAADLPTLFLDQYEPNAPLQDAVITNWWQCTFALPRIPSRCYAYYRHGDEKILYESRVFDALIGMVLREPLLWFAVSPALAEEVHAAGHQPLVLPNGVDVATFAAARPTLPPKRAALRVLIEGPIVAASKRVAPTIAALRPIPGLELVHMAADGSRPPAVDHALGAVPHHATPGIYAACDLIVKLSDAPESFAMPVLEQFAAGGTAVVSSFAGHEQYIDATNAMIVDVAAPYEAAVAAVTALRDDPAHLAALKAAATTTAQRFDWAPLNERFLASLEDDLRTKPCEPENLPLISRFSACHDELLALWAAEEGRKKLKQKAVLFCKKAPKNFCPLE